MLLESNPLLISTLLQVHGELNAIANEDLIDLQMSIMDATEAHNHVVKCHSLLKFRNSSLANLLIYKIPLAAFKTLFDEATSKRRNSDRYITALKIYMAASETAISPIFQPVYLKRMGYDPATQKDLYQIPLAYGNGFYYTFNGTVFNKITVDADRTAAIEKYTNGNMTLIHRSGDTYKPFIQDTDVESCIFAFQTVYKVMQDSGSNFAFLTNSIREVSFDATYPNKHTFIVSGEEVNETAPFIAAKYANRSHLCPPCDGVNFGFDLTT